MPVRFDAWRIVRLDDVNGLGLFRQLNADLALSTETIICPSDLELSAGTVLEKVDVAVSFGASRLFFTFVLALRAEVLLSKARSRRPTFLSIGSTQ